MERDFAAWQELTIDFRGRTAEKSAVSNPNNLNSEEGVNVVRFALRAGMVASSLGTRRARHSGSDRPLGR